MNDVPLARRTGVRGKAGWSFSQLESEFWRAVEDGPSVVPAKLVLNATDGSDGYAYEAASVSRCTPGKAVLHSVTMHSNVAEEQGGHLYAGPVSHINVTAASLEDGTCTRRPLENSRSGCEDRG